MHRLLGVGDFNFLYRVRPVDTDIQKAIKVCEMLTEQKSAISWGWKLVVTGRYGDKTK